MRAARTDAGASGAAPVSIMRRLVMILALYKVFSSKPCALPSPICMCVSCAPCSCVRAGLPRNSLRCGHRLRHHHLHASAVLIMAIMHWELSSSLQGLSLSNSRTCQRAQPHLGWLLSKEIHPQTKLGGFWGGGCTKRHAFSGVRTVVPFQEW